jgi:hypothetical protein
MQSLELSMTTMSVKNPTCEEFTSMFPISMFQNRTSYYNNESNSKFLENTKYGFSECLKQDVPKKPSFKFV